MARPANRKEDSRPTLRSGHKWPAFTLHTPPCMHPDAYMAGTSAVEDLRTALADRSRDEDWPSLPAPHQALVEEQAAAGSAPRTGKRSAAAQALLSASVQPSGVSSQENSASGRSAAAAAAASTSGTQDAAELPSFAMLKRGASDLKTHLSSAQERGSALVLVWCGSEGEAAAADSMAVLAEVSSAARSCAAVPVLLRAETSTSTANQALADALRVRELPCVQLYRDNKVRMRASIHVMLERNVLLCLLGERVYAFVPWLYGVAPEGNAMRHTGVLSQTVVQGRSTIVLFVFLVLAPQMIKTLKGPEAGAKLDALLQETLLQAGASSSAKTVHGISAGISAQQAEDAAMACISGQHAPTIYDPPTGELRKRTHPTCAFCGAF